MNLAYVVTAAIIFLSAAMDFIGYAIVSMWRDEYEHQLKQETDEPRQDEQRRSEARR